MNWAADLSRVRAVVFDLDDTLYLQAQFKKSGFGAVGAWLEARGIASEPLVLESLEKVIRSHGFSHPRMFNLMAEDLGVDERLVPELVEVLRSHKPTLFPFPGVPEALERLRPDYRLGLLTDGLARVQRSKVAALGIRDYFDELLFSDDLATAKPDERLFEWFEERFGLTGPELLHVGDNPDKDFRGARARGWLTVRVLTGESRAKVATGTDDAHLSIEGAWRIPELLAGQ